MNGTPSDGMPGARSIWQRLEAMHIACLSKLSCINMSQVKNNLRGFQFAAQQNCGGLGLHAVSIGAKRMPPAHSVYSKASDTDPSSESR